MKLPLHDVELPDPNALAVQIAAGRSVIAAAIMAAPVMTVRLAGTDTATARRVSWLTRMMAIRDGAIGVGGVLAARRGGNVVPWLLAGAASDAVDAVVLAGALRAGRAKGIAAALTVPLAGGTAIAGALTAARLRRN
jgi:hypothetical protein